MDVQVRKIVTTASLALAILTGTIYVCCQCVGR
jgi:hypothetical protein